MGGHVDGRLAQLVEQFVYTEKVRGSSPLSPTLESEAPLLVLFTLKHKDNLGVPVLISLWIGIFQKNEGYIICY